MTGTGQTDAAAGPPNESERSPAAAWLSRVWWQARPGWGALALLPLAALYRAAAWLQAAAYRRGWKTTEKVPVPVLVVGNLIVGGAGTTPTVIALVQALRAAGWTPGVISRGYGRDDGNGEMPMPVRTDSTATAVGDEPLLIALRTGVPVWVGRRRAAVARALCAAEPAVDLIVSDDGLQHRALARRAQVIVFDERGAGNGLLLPAGPLREPLPAQVPAASVVLYNAPSPSTPLPGWRAERRLAGAVSLAGWWRGEPASLAALHALRGTEVLAAAGLASPERFFTMLEAEGLHIRRLPLPDHHRYTQAPWPTGSGDVLITEKDAVKLRPDPGNASATGGAGPHIWVVALDFHLPPDFIHAVLSLLGPPPSP